MSCSKFTHYHKHNTLMYTSKSERRRRCSDERLDHGEKPSQGSAYVHALTQENQNIRLLQPNGSFPSARTSTFAVGQMWDLAFTPAHRSFPNGEDVLITHWKQLDPEPHLQACLSQRVTPWQGGPDQLFAG